MLLVGNFCILTQMDHVNHELNEMKETLQRLVHYFVV